MRPSEATDVVVMGASAGGVEALATVVGGLPADLPAAVLVVLHVSSASALPAILAKRSSLPVQAAVHGEPVQTGRVYVAPPDFHLRLDDGCVALDRGPRENRHRPAVDVLFRSAAESFGPRVIGVILSGSLDDGTAGLRRIKARGGRALVQDPDQALYASMPASALAAVDVDAVLALSEIPRAIGHMLEQRPGIQEVTAMSESTYGGGIEQPEATPTSPETRMYACPDCGGMLRETEDTGMIRYLCHTGHVYSPESLVAAQADEVESAMWSAVRSLRERAALLRRTSRRFTERHARSRAAMEQQADEAERQAAVIRGAIARMHTPAEEPVQA